MHILFLALMLCFFTSSAFAEDVYVEGYHRKDGTYVQPHYRSAPDSNPNNNWSTQGNTNPHTGQEGTKPQQPYGSQGGSYGASPYGGSSDPYGN